MSRDGKVLVIEAFSDANHLEVGASIGAVINGRLEQLRIVGIALSPEYVYEIRGAEVFPDNRRFGVLWMSRSALGPLFNMEGAFNDVVLTLAPGAHEAGVLDHLDRLLEPYDINHLPGVERSEAFRIVPARLHFGHRSKRLALQGIAPHADLRRIVGQNLGVTQIPPDGVLLTTKLADVLAS